MRTRMVLVVLALASSLWSAAAAAPAAAAAAAVPGDPTVVFQNGAAAPGLPAGFTYNYVRDADMALYCNNRSMCTDPYFARAPAARFSCGCLG